MEYGDDLKGLELGAVDDLIITDRPEENRLACEIVPTVPLAGHGHQTENGIVNLESNALGSLKVFLSDVFVDVDEVLGGLGVLLLSRAPNP